MGSVLFQSDYDKYQTATPVVLSDERSQERISVDRTPQQNRVAERKNRTLIEAARTKLADSLLPTTFWSSIKQKDDGIFISQDKYVADILKKFDFTTVKTASTPIEPNKALIKDTEAEDVDVYLYRSMIGSLMYLTASRPDIMFAVCACARELPFYLEAFSDSDYAGASLDRKSTTGGCQFLDKRHVLWIQNQMLDYGFNFMNTKIYIDNESIICIVKNLVFCSKTKHIKIRHDFIRDSYEKKLIQVHQSSMIGLDVMIQKS
nr:hypothetical protein [Tanacetum cinerariifolium]